MRPNTQIWANQWVISYTSDRIHYGYQLDRSPIGRWSRGSNQYHEYQAPKIIFCYKSGYNLTSLFQNFFYYYWFIRDRIIGSFMQEYFENEQLRNSLDLSFEKTTKF